MCELLFWSKVSAGKQQVIVEILIFKLKVSDISVFDFLYHIDNLMINCINLTIK